MIEGWSLENDKLLSLLREWDASCSHVYGLLIDETVVSSNASKGSAPIHANRVRCKSYVVDCKEVSVTRV